MDDNQKGGTYTKETKLSFQDRREMEEWYFEHKEITDRIEKIILIIR
jgi:hypothetical protein